MFARILGSRERTVSDSSLSRALHGQPLGLGTAPAGKELAKVVILKVMDRFVMTVVPARE